MQMQWVLYGVPSEQLAREWAQVEFEKKQSSSDYKIERMLVLPVNNTLHTEDGPIIVPWGALPGEKSMESVVPSHDTFYIMAPNKKPQLPANISPRDERASLQKGLGDRADLNWDVSKSWYYIVYTKHLAVLVKEVNAAAAAIPYARHVRGMSAGDEIATVTPWQGLTYYQQPSPALIQH